MRQEELSFLSHAPIGSLCSLSSFSHNGGFNTKRSLIKRREAALQASTETSVPFLHIPRPFDKNDFICVPRSVLFHARQAGGAGFTFNYSAKHEIPCGIPVSTYSSKAPTAVQVYHAHKARRQPHAGPARTAVPLVQPYLTGCLRFTKICWVGKQKRCSSRRYNERQLIEVTVVIRVRPRAERWCDCEGHRRWKRAGRTLFCR